MYLPAFWLMPMPARRCGRLQNDPNRLLALPYKLGLALRAPGLLAAYTLAKQRFL